MTSNNVQTSTQTTARPSGGSRPRVAWRAVGAFVALAYAGAWATTLPLLLSGYHRTEATPGMGLFVQVTIALTMLTPATAALVVLRWIHRPASLRTAIGLVWPRPAGRLVRQSLLALAVPLCIQLAALGVATLAGTYHPDLANLSGFREAFAPDTADQPGLPLAAAAAWAGVELVGLLVWLPMFFGEELGWQGYLLPRLAPLGSAPALVLTAATFALWHLPALIMGGQYPGHSWPVSVAAFLVSTTLMLPVFAWLRMRSGSVWPAVLAHSVVSGPAVSLVYLFSDAEARIDLLKVGMTGWPGWIVTGALVAVLAATGRLRVSTLLPNNDNDNAAR